MSESVTPNERWITIDTQVEGETLVATELRGVEGVSRLFEFKVSVVCKLAQIEPQQLLGKSVALSLAWSGHERRRVHGMVVSFAAGPKTRSDFRHYELTLAPKLWGLGKTSDYKVFQNETVVDIVESILGEHTIDFEKNITAGDYKLREYCVQFGETDLAFVERLLREEGIFYFFKHEATKHTLVLGDSTRSYADCAQTEVLVSHGAEDSTDCIYEMRSGAHLTSSKRTLSDYDLEQKTSTGTASTSVTPASSMSLWERFDHPGDAPVYAQLQRRAGHLVDADEAEFQVTTGRSTCASFVPGHRFSPREGHEAGVDVGERQVLDQLDHHVVDHAYFAFHPDVKGKPSYRNSFACVPATRSIRPKPLSARPLARGPMTATVVGPSGEALHTDKYGRVRVQFHWDRYGANNETSSCFVRVAQSLAGPGWGAVFIPRIGMEVVVQFVDGDPDRPLVTGAVYNADNLPPWVQEPAGSVKTGLMTRSVKGAKTNANELSFEDKKGEEKVLFHAEKDFVREVENDDTLDVGHDQTRTIKNNRTTTITEGNDTFTISKGNQVEKLDQGNREVTLAAGNDTLKLTQGNRTVELSAGNDSLKLTQGNRSVELSAGNDSLTLSQGDLSITASLGSVTIEAMNGITLKCGSSTIEIKQAGVTIKGIKVEASGTASAALKGAMVEVAGSGMTTVKGGIVKIN